MSKLRTTTDPDPAELDHSEWLNYVSSAQHLQTVAHVLEKKVKPTSKLGSTDADGPPQSVLNTEEAKERREEQAEERRRYLVDAKKSRKYVASTLFHGKYIQNGV